MLIINYKHIQIGIDWLCKYYKTNILGLYVGPFLAAVANDSASIKETMLNPKMDGRPDLFLAQLRDPNNVTRGDFLLHIIATHFSNSIDNCLQEFSLPKAYIGEMRDDLR